MLTYTRLPLAVGDWQSNFIALPSEFARAVRASPDFSAQGVICFKLVWTAFVDEQQQQQQQATTTTKECFVGWSGLISRGPFVQVPLKLAQLCGLYNEDNNNDSDALLVNVYAVKQCAVARRVDLDPETVEDWEALEKHAGFVEEQMLSQIAVVFPGQRFCVWVANLPVKLRVVDCGSSSGLGAVRLGNDSEIVVAPKPRPVAAARESQQPLQKLEAKSRFVPAKGKAVKLRVQVLARAHLDGVGYVARETLEVLRTSAGWSVFAGEANSPDARVFFQVGNNNNNNARAPVLLALDVSEEVAPFHLGVTRASCRTELRAFERVTLRPISAVEHLLTYSPNELELRRIVYNSKREDGDNEIVLVDKAEVLRELTSTLDSDVAIQHDGCWLSALGGKVYFKLHSPITNRFWFSKEKPERFTFGEDICIEEEGDGEESAPRAVELPAASRKVLKEMIQHFAPLLSRKQSKLRVTELKTLFSGGVYLYAPRGFGKRTLLRELERELGSNVDTLTNFVHVDCTELRGRKRHEVMEAMDSALALAKQRHPSLIVFSELDSLLPQPANPSEEEDASTVWLSEHLERMISNHKREHGKETVGFVATGRGKRSLRVSLLRLGSCFEQSYEVLALDRDARRCVLRSLLARSSSSPVDEEEVERVAGRTEGFTCADLETLVERSAVQRLTLERGLEGFVPANLRGVKLAKSDTVWSDVGGLSQVRNVLKDTLELPFQFAELYKSSPLRLASGILLYGASGTGKTLLAGAVASECGLNFISVKGPEILNKYIGASEQAIRDLFSRAASVAPCIIFFDEFDAIAPRRGNDSTGVTDRVVNQMLTFLDGVESREGVYVMAATSRPDLVDPALLRPGRLDKQLLCNFPDEEEREDILRAVTRKVRLAADCDLKRFAREGKELTGADLQAMVATAQLLAAHDNCLEISQQHLQRAFADTRPSVSREDRVKLEQLYAKFRGDRDMSMVGTDQANKQRVALM